MQGIRVKLKEHISKREEVKELSEKIEHLKDSLTSIKSSSQFGVRAASGSYDKIGEFIATIERLETIYYKKMCDLTKETIEIEQIINALPSRERRLIRSRYLEGHTFEQICYEMNYSWRHVHRLHGEALKKLEAL